MTTIKSAAIGDVAMSIFTPAWVDIGEKLPIKAYIIECEHIAIALYPEYTEIYYNGEWKYANS